MVRQQQFEIETRGRGFYEISERLQRWLAGSGCRRGLCHLFLRHTSASLCLCENAAPEVRLDLERWAQTLAPDGASYYQHDDEGPDDMAAHIRSLTAGVEMTVPVRDARLLLGTWQGIYVWEHRLEPQTRQLVATIHGEFSSETRQAAGVSPGDQ